MAYLIVGIVCLVAGFIGGILVERKNGAAIEAAYVKAVDLRERAEKELAALKAKV